MYLEAFFFLATMLSWGRPGGLALLPGAAEADSGPLLGLLLYLPLPPGPAHDAKEFWEPWQLACKYRFVKLNSLQHAVQQS